MTRRETFLMTRSINFILEFIYHWYILRWERNNGKSETNPEIRKLEQNFPRRSCGETVIFCFCGSRHKHIQSHTEISTMEINENECLARKYQVADYAEESIKSIRKIGSFDCDSTSSSADRGMITCLGMLHSGKILYPWDFSCAAQTIAIRTWQSQKEVLSEYFQAQNMETCSREWFITFHLTNRYTAPQKFFIIKINIKSIK